MKPTYGTVSRYGLIAYGSSLDQIGPVAKDVTDCAAILETIAAHDEKDSTSIGRDSYDFTSALVEDVKGMKIGSPLESRPTGMLIPGNPARFTDTVYTSLRYIFFGSLKLLPSSGA